VGANGTHDVADFRLGSTAACDRTQPFLDVNTPFIGGFNGVGYGPNSFADVYDTASVGTMRYDALQAVLQKRASGGLQGQIAYTWGKCMTDNVGIMAPTARIPRPQVPSPIGRISMIPNRIGRAATMIPARS
jgi:hypothetical protein